MKKNSIFFAVIFTIIALFVLNGQAWAQPSGKYLRLTNTSSSNANTATQYLQIPTNDAINVAAGAQKTITFWIRTTSTYQSRIFCKRASAGGTNQSTAGISGTGYEYWMGTGAYVLQLAGNAYTTGSTSFSTAGYKPGSSISSDWHHLAIVFDNSSTNKTVKFYIDGANENYKAGTFSGTYDFSNLVNLIVGAGANLSYGYTGDVDDIRVWNKAMTVAELATDMTSTIDTTNISSDLLAAWNFSNVSSTGVVPDISGHSLNGQLYGSPTIINPDTTMKYVKTTITQTSIPTGIGNKGEQILHWDVVTSGTSTPLTLQKVYFKTTGTTLNADISNIRIFSTGSSSKYDTTTLAGTAQAADGTLSVSMSKTLADGDNHFWIAYDVSSAAVEGNILDGQIDSLKISDSTYKLSQGNITGSRTIFLKHKLVFSPGDGGAVSYRIPAIITAADGSLVTITDKRWNSTADLANKIDPVCRRSTDGGKTWSDPVVLANFGASTGAGDAAIVLDKSTGNLISLMAAQVGIFSSTRSNPTRVLKCVSQDNGATWSAPVDITDAIYGLNSAWVALFVASGRGTQLRNGNLAFLIAAREPNTSGTLQLNNYYIYSTDGGSTWKSGGLVASAGDEAKVLELDNGSLLASIRSSPTRRYNTSTDGGLTWGTDYHNTSVLDPACDGDLIRYTSTLDGYTKSRILQSVPYASGRSNVSILMSTDEGQTWGYRKSIFSGSSAYSSMTILPDNTIGIYYENGESATYDMYFANISLSFLTDGQDALEQTLPVTIVSFAVDGSIKNSVNAQWSLSGTTDLQTVTLEQSTDGKNFTTVKSYTAEDGTKVGDVLNYQITTLLKSSSSKNYFRLKVTNLDGSITYSEIKSITTDVLKTITLSPNPAKNYIVVTLDINSKASLIDINGHQYKSMELKPGNNKIDISTLNSGLYFIRLVNSNGTNTLKFIKN